MTPEHWVAIIAAALGFLGVVFTAVFAWLGVLSKRATDTRAANEARTRELEQRIAKLERRERLSWIYIRSLIDSHYRHAPGVPLPQPPEGWNED